MNTAHETNALRRRSVVGIGVIGLIAAISACVPPIAAANEPAAQAPVLSRLHGLGLTGAPLVPSASASLKLASATATPPASYDLTPWAIAPGDQGRVGSCAAWAVVYSALGYYQRHDGVAGGALAPMYTYAQISKGVDNGSSLQANLDIAKAQGVDTQADYVPQGNMNFTTQPTAAQTTNAAKWKLSAYTALTVSQANIQTSISSGHPVLLGINVYDNFMTLTSANNGFYSGISGNLLGGHAVTALGYDATGVRIENSWGTGWGASGFATLAWSYITTQVTSAIDVGPFVAGAPTAPTSTTTTTSSTTTTTAATTTTAKATTTTVATTTTAKSATTTTAKAATTTTTSLTVPKVSAMSPNYGLTTGNTSVTITGTGLAGATVKFGTTAVAATVNTTGTSLTFKTPAGTVGNTTVTVTGGSTTGTFTYAVLPTVTSLSPASGAATATTTVTVTGAGFNGGPATVTIGTKTVSPTTVNATGTSMTVAVPTGTKGATTFTVKTGLGTATAVTWTYT